MRPSSAARKQKEIPSEEFQETRDSVSDVWGPRTPYRGKWAPRVDMRLDLPPGVQPDRWVQSACVLCSNGCACDIAVKDGKIVGVRGRAVDRVNRGRLGPKGLHGWVANNAEDRLTQPLIRGRDGKLHAVSWDQAMDLIVQKSREVVKEYTSHSLGIYNSGQLFIEEYYTLSVLAHAGLRTLTMDGNTRLCTATAASALKETFGADGQPGSFADIDTTDCLFLVGHNMASTQTVLWTRVLDRLAGPRPPQLVVVDPRETETARAATVHLAPRVGTNVALLNGIIHLLIEKGCIDETFIRNHTVGFERLKRIAAEYSPARVESLTGIAQAKLKQAAEVLGSARTILSTVLQGVYQSNQATAAAVQVNNINLIRGMIGKPGAGILQMNGQPTAQNTRETGCDGEFPAFFNYENPEHIRQLAEHWNVSPDTIPHWSEPYHIMEIFRMAELGSVRMLWVICTNPAVSLPELHRIRKILDQSKLFLVVQDAFLTETARMADVVLPAAIWGEKTGTFTNADRTVHLSHQAVPPPGEAKSDLDIFLEYSKRMGFQDREGKPLVKWSDAEGAFEHWKQLSRGRPCDYSGLSYKKLSEGSGIQWPCNDHHPNGTERLYRDRVFPTAADVCQTFGHHLETGGAITEQDYRSNDPQGRAILKAARYRPFQEEPDETFPFRLTTGRVIFQFHTRTKTARSPELDGASKDAFAQIHETDAARLGIVEGDRLLITSRRGSIRVRATLGGIEPGHVFVPFHFGYWDETKRRLRAANELTLTTWDPVSKQPIFKYAAVDVRKEAELARSNLLSVVSEQVKDRALEVADKLMSRTKPERVHLPDYLGILVEANRQFSMACREVASRHVEEKAIQGNLSTIAQFSEDFVEALKPFSSRYGQRDPKEPEKLRESLFSALRGGTFGLLRELHDLYLLYSETHIALTIVGQAAQALQDHELHALVDRFDQQNQEQRNWLLHELKHRAPPTLVIPQR